MTLRSLAQELTQPHLKMIGGQVAKRPAALELLREAISHSSSGGGESNDGKPLPLDGQALSLLMTIRRMSGEDHQSRYGEAYFGTLDNLINKIGNDEHEPEWEHWFTRIYQQWIDSINELLNPTKVRRLDGTPCPACGLTVAGPKRETCLIVNCYKPGTKDLLPPGQWTAQCRGCDARWETDVMKWLVATLHT